MKYIPRKWISRTAAVALVAAGVTFAIAAPARADIISATTFTLASGQTGSARMVCTGGGSFIASGGALSTTPFVKLWASYPDTDTSWTVNATNFASNTQSITIRTQCITSPPSYWRQAKNVAIGTGGVANAVATCPSGRTAMGGGWLATDAGVATIASRPSGTNSWQLRGRNFNASTSSITSFVTCIGSIGPVRHVDPPFVTTVAPNGTVNPIRQCSSGGLFGAGFNVTDDSGFTIVTASIPTRDFSINTDTWKYNFKNLDAVAHTIEQTLVCYG